MNEILTCLFGFLFPGVLLGIILTLFGFFCDFKIKNLKHKKNIKKLQRLRIKLMLNKG